MSQRLCRWCDGTYDTNKDSSSFCTENPNRERELRRLDNKRDSKYANYRKNNPPFTMLAIPSNPNKKLMKQLTGRN